MGTRQEIQQRREAMRQALIAECRAASAGDRPSTLLPPLHELSSRFELSVPLVSATIKELEGEGVLHTRRGAGTYVGRQPLATRLLSAPFLLVMSDDGSGAMHRASIRRGFEERIGTLGGSSLSLSVAGLRQMHDQGPMLPLAGVFDFPEWSEPGLPTTMLKVPRVAFECDPIPEGGADVVDFDNVGGGTMATEHLLRLGHRRVAFLGMHGTRETVSQVPWSAQRAAGWARALRAAGKFEARLLFTEPARSNASPPQGEAARVASERFLQLLLSGLRKPAEAVTAVVAANHIAAYELLEVLAESALPVEFWPSIVAFDEQAVGGGHVLSTLRLPWEEVGFAAADLLWQRAREATAPEPVIIAPPKQQLIAMKLILRLTCQPVWSSTPGALALAMPGRHGVLPPKKTPPK